MRAWSLIDRFSADLNWLFITTPGSKPEWDAYCERYNKRLLGHINAKDNIPALDPKKVVQTLSNYVTKNVAEKYNVFISPLGTKLQLLGALYFIVSSSRIPINIVTTTVVNHNIPYYSWDIGDTFEFYFPHKGDMQ